MDIIQGHLSTIVPMFMQVLSAASRYDGSGCATLIKSAYKKWFINIIYTQIFTYKKKDIWCVLWYIYILQIPVKKDFINVFERSLLCSPRLDLLIQIQLLMLK